MALHWQSKMLFNMLSRLVIAFLPRSKHLLISWLQSPSAVILEPPKIKSVTVSIISPSICHEVMGPDAMFLAFFECRVLSQLFHSPLSLSSRGSLDLLHFLPLRVVWSAYLRLLIFLPAIFIPACSLYVSPYKFPWKSTFSYNSQNCIPIIQSQITCVYTLCLLISRYGQLYEMTIIWLNSFLCHKCKTLSLMVTVCLRCYFAESSQVQSTLDSHKGSLPFLKTKFHIKIICL